MSSEIKYVSGDKLSGPARREVSDGATTLAHVTFNAVGNFLSMLVQSQPTIETAPAAAVMQSAHTGEPVPAYTPAQPLEAAAPVVEVDPGFAAGFSPDKIWDGSLAEDHHVEPMAAKPAPQRNSLLGGLVHGGDGASYAQPQPSQPSALSEVTSAPETGMAGMPIDEHQRFVEAVADGGVYDQMDGAETAARQAAIEAAHAQLADIYTQQERN